MTALAGSVNALYPQARTTQGRTAEGRTAQGRTAQGRTAAQSGGYARTRQGWTR